MFLVRMMQASVHQVIDVIAMRHSFVPATWAMYVFAVNVRSAVRGVSIADGHCMFTHTIAVHVLQVSVLEIVHVPFVQNRCVPAIRAMYMSLGHVCLRTL